MSIATGRDPQAYNLLSTPPSSVRIAIPSICCMEALSALEDELKRRNRFENDLNLQISQLRRDVTSPYPGFSFSMWISPYPKLPGLAKFPINFVS